MKNKKITKADIITFTLLLLSLLLIINHRIEKKTIKEYKTVEDLYSLPEPVQEQYDDVIYRKNGIYKSKIHLKNTYLIQGRVVGTAKYLPISPTGSLSPIDIGIVWGEFAKDEILEQIKFKSTYGRFLLFSFKNSNFETEHPDYKYYISNNHIIPSNKKIAKALKYIKKGDFIELEGYLVDANIDFWQITHYWESSTTRNDTGDGACEVIYVTSIKWLKEE